METENCILGFDDCFDDGIFCNSSSNFDSDISENDIDRIMKDILHIKNA